MHVNILKYSVGIDVSKKILEVCFKELHPDQITKIKGSRKFNNTPKGFEMLLEWIEKRRKNKDIPCVVILEATGVYHENAAYYLYNAGLKVSIILPNHAKSFMQSLGFKSKNDRIDSRGLAQMGAERNLPFWTAPNEQMIEVRSLTRHKGRLEETKTSCSNRLHAQNHSAHSNTFVINQLESQIEMIETQVEMTRQTIEKLLESETNVNNRIKMIADSIRGIGYASIASIVAETNGFELFESQGQLTSYAGYDVVENQSGNRSGKTKISKKGNKYIRKTMHFPALNVVRWDVDVFANLHNRVFDRTKIPMKAYVAVQRKLLCMIYTLWKKEEAFESNYQNRFQKDMLDEIPAEMSISPLFV